MENWTPKTEGYGFELTRILERLAPVQDDLLVMTGVTHDKERANNDGAGDHARSASVFLTVRSLARPIGERFVRAFRSISWRHSRREAIIRDSRVA